MTNAPPIGTKVRRGTPVPGVDTGAIWDVVPAKTVVSSAVAHHMVALVKAGVDVGSGTWGCDTSDSDVEASVMGKPSKVHIESVSTFGWGFWFRVVGGSSKGERAISLSR